MEERNETVRKYKVVKTVVTASDGYEEKTYVFYVKVPRFPNLREIVPITRKTKEESKKWTF